MKRCEECKYDFFCNTFIKNSDGLLQPFCIDKDEYERKRRFNWGLLLMVVVGLASTAAIFYFIWRALC